MNGIELYALGYYHKDNNKLRSDLDYLKSAWVDTHEIYQKRYFSDFLLTKSVSHPANRAEVNFEGQFKKYFGQTAHAVPSHVCSCNNNYL